MTKRTLLWLVGIAIVVGVTLELSVSLLSAAAVLNGETPIELFLPKPTDTFAKMVTAATVILPDLLYTLARASLGLLAGVMLAMFVVYTSSINPIIRTSSRLLSYSINAFPLVGFAPLVVLTFGQGSEAGMIFLAMLLSYFPVYIALEHAAQTIPDGLKDIAKILQLTTRQEFRLIVFPEIKGALLNSLRLAVPASVVGATIGEWLGAQYGIGRLVAVSLYQFNAELMYAALLYLVVFNILFLVVLSYLEKIFVVPRK